jgi:hypothetical protein
VHSFLNIIIASSFLIITRNSDAFFSYSVKIEILSVAFSASIFSPARAIDRFSAVLSIFAKSFS